MLSTLSIAILGVLLPPLAVALVKGIDIDFAVNLLLTILLPLVGGIIHAFNTFGVPLLINLVSLIFPPASVLITRGFGTDFLINIIFTLLADVPGIIHAYALALSSPHKEI